MNTPSFPIGWMCVEKVRAKEALRADHSRVVCSSRQHPAPRPRRAQSKTGSCRSAQASARLLRRGGRHGHGGRDIRPASEVAPARTPASCTPTVTANDRGATSTHGKLFHIAADALVSRMVPVSGVGTSRNNGEQQMHAARPQHSNDQLQLRQRKLTMARLNTPRSNVSNE